MDDDRFRPPFGFSSGYFGSNRRPPPMTPFEDEEDDSPFGGFGEDIFSRFRFGNFGRNGNDMEDIFRGAETMLRHMDSMFQDMHSYGGSSSFGRIMGPGSDDHFPGSGSRRSPRDEMLKEPESDSAIMVLDPDAEEEDQRDSSVMPQGRRGPGGWSSWTGSSSMSSFRGFGDGKTEEKRTIQNGDGSKSVIVTRRMGDKEWTVTTKTDRNGETEVVEDLINMDEDEKADFEAGWKSASPARHVQRYDDRGRLDGGEIQPAAPILDPHAPSIFSKLFGSWFR